MTNRIDQFLPDNNPLHNSSCSIGYWNSRVATAARLLIQTVEDHDVHPACAIRLAQQGGSAAADTGTVSGGDDLRIVAGMFMTAEARFGADVWEAARSAVPDLLFAGLPSRCPDRSADGDAPRSPQAADGEIRSPPMAEVEVSPPIRT